MNSLNAQLLELLKCPCCSEYMTGAIYLCISGHSICNNCSPSKTCYVCKLKLTDIRNCALENVGVFVSFPCANAEQGCQQYLQTNRLCEHESVCDYRSYFCQLDKKCGWEGPRSALRKHYLDKHDKSILIGNEVICLWKEDKPDYSIYLIIAFDELFYVHCNIKNGIVHWAVQYIGRSEDVILFCFEIQIFTDQYNDRRLEFSELCHDDVKTDINDIIDSGYCVAVPLAVFETYKDNEGAVFYKVVIKRV